MDAAYHQKRYHFVQFLWGMLIGFIPGRFMQCGYKFSRWYDMEWMEKHIGEHTEKVDPVRFFILTIHLSHF